MLLKKTQILPGFTIKNCDKHQTTVALWSCKWSCRMDLLSCPKQVSSNCCPPVSQLRFKLGPQLSSPGRQQEFFLSFLPLSSGWALRAQLASKNLFPLLCHPTWPLHPMGCGAFFPLNFSSLVTWFYFGISNRLGLLSLALLRHPKIQGQVGSEYKTWFCCPHGPPARLAMATLAGSEWEYPAQHFTWLLERSQFSGERAWEQRSNFSFPENLTTGKKLGLDLARSCSEFLPCIFVEGCISTFIYKTDPKTNAHKLFLPSHCYLGAKAPVFNHMTRQDKPYNKKQTMPGQPRASKPWSPFVQHFPRRLLEIPVNKAECRESTSLKQRAQHSGLLNHLSYSPGEKEFATESHKWTEFARLKPASLPSAASPAWHHCSMSTNFWWEESRDWEMQKKKDVSVQLFLKLSLALVCIISRSPLDSIFSLFMVGWGFFFNPVL